MATLLIQVLGNSDVSVEGKKGIDILKGCTLEDVKYYAEEITKEALEDISTVNFPLIKNLINNYGQTEPVYLVVLLTDQSDWIASQDIYGEAWREIIASDGIWWQEILEKWCEVNEINYYPITVKITPTIKKGSADWEGIASLIAQQFHNYFNFQKSPIRFTPNSKTSLEIEKIIIQHSSGTPALSSAVYLWGIEQKLRKQPVEFVYFSRQDSLPYVHSGSHWQWRLKVPQIEQLLAIQDFSGILQLVDDPTIAKQVRKLDKAISFNLSPLTPKEDVVERIAIAKWSELAFRERGQWMHWYLRIAGAFELALHCLVEHQGNNQYEWTRDKNKVFLSHQNNDLSFVQISKIVKELLSKGSYSYEYLNANITYKVEKITDPKWRDFVNFYCNHGWCLNANNNLGFIKLRNELYHSLKGDIIDRLLDQKTEILGKVTDSEHPSQKAIEWLEYLLELSNYTEMVNGKVKFYGNLVEELKKAIYT